MLKWLFVIAGVLGLIGVRVIEHQAFYDPFLQYFSSADKKAHFPEFEWTPLILSYIFRFLLNLLFSAVIIQALFQDRRWTVQGLALLAIVFIVTLPIYLYCIYTKFEIGYLFSFYMRRFVIQPLILLLVVPMFYYRKQFLDRK